MTPAALHSWLLERALPLWLEHGVDWRKGAFLEELHPDGLVSKAGFRRLRVAARQVYVFARAAELGVKRAAEARDLGLAWIAAVRQPDGGYVSRTDLAGTPIEPMRDLYDHAFVLLALAHGGRRDEAMALLAYLTEHFRHEHGGWRESLPDALPRRQNPHMHLLEAMLSAFEHLGEPAYLDVADELIALFAQRLYQPAEGALPEYFTADLMPVREAGCYLVEPGHHHEWVWLLAEHRRISQNAGRGAPDTAGIGTALLDFAERLGVDAAGELSAELWSDGRVASNAARIWPYTERIKALAATGRETECAGACKALGRLLDHPVAGLWHERRNAAPGAAAPASSLYHLTCAILELGTT